MLALELDVGDRAPARARRGHDGAALLRRHDLVLRALEGDQRAVQCVEVIQRAALAVHRQALGQRCDQAIGVAALELVRVLGERDEVRHAEVVDPGAEAVGPREQGQHRVAARAATAHGHSRGVDAPGGRQRIDGRHRVLHVHHAPGAVQVLAVGAAKPRAAAVIDVDHREAAARPELLARVELRSGVAGRATVQHHHQRWRPGGSSHRGVARRMEEGVGLAGLAGRPCRGGKDDGLGHRDLVRLQRALAGAAQHLAASAPRVDRLERGQRVRVGCDGMHAPVRQHADRPQGDGRQIDGRGGPARQIDEVEFVERVARDPRHGAALIEQCVARESQVPQGSAEIGGQARDCAHAAGLEHLQVPPAALVREKVQVPVRPPLRFEHRDARASRHCPQAGETGRPEFAHHQACGVPGHVRVIPGDEREAVAVAADPRIGDEIRGPIEHLALGLGRRVGL